MPRVTVAWAISRESFSWKSLAEWCPCSLSRWLRAATSTMVVRLRPGRNLTTIVEVAARNHLLKLQGHHSAKDFQEKLSREIAQATVTRGIGDEVE